MKSPLSYYPARYDEEIVLECGSLELNARLENEDKSELMAYGEANAVRKGRMSLKVRK